NCSWRSLLAGVRSVLHKRFRAEVLLIIGIVAVVWFDIDAFFRDGGGATFAALPLAVALTASTWIELLEWETRYRTVRLLQNRGVKYAAIDQSAEDEDRLVLSPVRYVDGYDEIYSYREDTGFQILLAVLTVGVAVGGFLTAYLPTHTDIARAFSVGVSVMLLACPFAALLSRRIWFNALSRAFLDGGTAVIGEDAAYRYAHVTTFSVEDGDAFSGEETRIRIVNVFRDSRLDEILRLLSEIYYKLGGPLSRVLAETASDGVYGDAEITEIIPGGVTARVEGKTVVVGSGEYLAQNGFSLPEVDVDKVLKNDRMCILFVAYDGEVRARFYIEYVLSRAFEARAEKLRKLGVLTEIRTFDPCLTPSYFSRISYLPDEAVKIKRMGVADVDVEAVRRAESGLFALGSLSMMLDALHAFRRYVHARGWLGFFKFAQFIIGAGCAAFFLIRFPNTPIPAWASAIYGLVLLLLSIRRASVSGKRISDGMRSARSRERK
ncbi:MAG: cation-translocating P-type ATPase, partial [Clostridia bacterium]|nr:cation-translocating P-type ATPase [Clostridia bacterium]